MVKISNNKISSQHGTWWLTYLLHAGYNFSDNWGHAGYNLPDNWGHAGYNLPDNLGNTGYIYSLIILRQPGDILVINNLPIHTSAFPDNTGHAGYK